MTKHVLISYKWEQDRPEERWLFWLQKTLEQKGFTVTMSALHLETIPKNHDWVSDIKTIYSISDENTYHVAHDPGCLSILSYLEALAKKGSEETVLLVAGLDPSKLLSNSKESKYIPQNTSLVVLYSSLGPLLKTGDKPRLTQK